MRGRTVLLAAAAVGVGYGLWKPPVTQRFVSDGQGGLGPSRGRVREAVEVAVETARPAAPLGTPRGPRPRPRRGGRLGPQPGPRRRHPGIRAGVDDPGRSLTPERARALLLDPTGERAP